MTTGSDPFVHQCELFYWPAGRRCRGCHAHVAYCTECGADVTNHRAGCDLSG